MMFHHALPLPRFESLLLSGAVAQQGAVIDSHRVKLRSQKIIDARGAERKALAPIKLAASEQLLRVLDCSKPGFHPSLGFDSFEHTERILKRPDLALEVTNRMAWHSGASYATRTYVATAAGAGHFDRLITHNWESSMAGIGSRFTRAIVSRALGRALPRIDAQMAEVLQVLTQGPQRHAA
jgi:hypothetical protein